MLELLTAILNRTDSPVPRCGAYLREAYRTGLLVRSSPWPLLTDDGLRYVEKAIGV